MTCPPEHKHGATTTCYHDHACRCTPCTQNMSARARTRYRMKAYGRYEGRIELTGTIRRFQGLQVMGWRADDIAYEMGTHAPALFRMLRQKWITPETRDRFAAVTERLARQGRGPSQVTTVRAARKGWVSPFAWDDIDRDTIPAPIEGPRVLKGDELLAEVDYLIDAGESPDQIARALHKSAATLERHAWRAQRNDLASFFGQAAKREAA